MARSFARPARELEELEAVRQRERAEGERALARLRRELEEIEARAKDQADIFKILPDLVRQMFAVSGRRGVGPLALKLLDHVFEPEQVAIFVARKTPESVLDQDFLARPGRSLVLAAGRGLPPELAHRAEIELGQGRVGYVAEHRLAMDAADFASLAPLAKRSTEAGPAGLRADVAAPIEDESGLIGVLCMGAVRQRQDQAKRLLKMVADLTAIALTHVTQLRMTEQIADMDGLTGVFNKRYLQKRLGEEIHRAEKQHLPLSLLILDIDHFKNYNDTNGHLEGDDVLRRVGQLLKGSIREDDMAARYGGEEFVVLYPGATKDQALRVAEALRRAVEAHPFAFAARQPLGAVTISGGVATYPEDALTGVELIRSADQALYEAKSSGRNRIVAARPAYLT